MSEYMSEVGIALTLRGAQCLKGLVMSSPISKQLRDLLAKADHFKHRESGARLIHWQQVCWNSVAYSEIIEMERCLKALNEKDYRFVKVGSSFGDVRELGDFIEKSPWKLTVERSVAA